MFVRTLLAALMAAAYLLMPGTSPLAQASEVPGTEVPATVELPRAAVLELIERHYAIADIGVVRLDDGEPLAQQFRDAGADVYAITGHTVDSAELIEIGALVTAPEGVIASVYVPQDREYEITGIDLTGNLGTSSRAAEPSQCNAINGAIIALDGICLTFIQEGNPAFAVCQAARVPLYAANTLVFFACAFDATYSIAIHQIPNGGTGCSYTNVSGQYYAKGATCWLRYSVERGPVSTFPDTPRSNIRSINAYLCFYADGNSGYDVGCNQFANDKFQVTTVINGAYHNFREKPTVQLQTGTSTKPRFGRAQQLYVEYYDGSFGLAKDAYPIR